MSSRQLRRSTRNRGRRGAGGGDEAPVLGAASLAKKAAAAAASESSDSESDSGSGGGGGEEAVANRKGPTARRRGRRELESAVDEADELASLSEHSSDEDDVEGDDGDSDSAAGDGGEGTDEKKTEEAAVWVDEDEEDVSVDLGQVSRLRKLRTATEESRISGREYSNRLRERFAKTNPSTSWAAVDETAGSDDDDAVVRTTAPLFGSSTLYLKPGRINMSRLKDANYREPSHAVVQSVRFHPGGKLLLTGGFDKRLRLFRVDGKSNQKVQSVMFPDMPVHSAEFVADGREVIASGRRKFFYSCDLTSGKINKIGGIVGRKEKSLERFVVSPDSSLIAFLGNDGYIMLVSRHSKAWVANLKMNSAVRAACFTPDGTQLLTTGVGGEVYRWDLRTQRAALRHKDEGSMCGCSIGVSPDGSRYAIGSDMGVVNVYDTNAVSSFAADEAKLSAFGVPIHAPKPAQSIMNLRTAVDHLKFNHDGQILTIASQRMKDSLKLVHVSSGSVFANWPTSKTPLSYVTSLDFSPHSGLFAAGNDRGRVLLYRVSHYPSV